MHYKKNVSHHMRNAWIFPEISQSMVKCNKTHHRWRTWEIGTHSFLMVWALFLIRFPCYSILHHVGNAWVSPSIYHILGKYSKTQQTEIAWEVDTNNFPKVWILFLHQISLLGYTSSHGKYISQGMGKYIKTTRLERPEI